MRYRKKPIVIEAIQWTPCKPVMEEMLLHFGLKPILRNNMDIVIETLEGAMVAHPTDYIIKGIKGEFYPCKKDIFEATYEKVEDDAVS